MQPIINPMFFYWVKVADIFKGLSALASGLSCAITIVSAFSYEECDWSPNQTRKFFTISITICVITMLLAVFIPSKETLYQMLAAQFITPDNVQNTADALIQFSTELMKAFGS